MPPTYNANRLSSREIRNAIVYKRLSKEKYGREERETEGDRFLPLPPPPPRTSSQRPRTHVKCSAAPARCSRGLRGDYLRPTNLPAIYLSRAASRDESRVSQRSARAPFRRAAREISGRRERRRSRVTIFVSRDTFPFFPFLSLFFFSFYRVEKNEFARLPAGRRRGSSFALARREERDEPRAFLSRSSVR